MPDAQDIADSTDWLNTPLAGLAPVENALHCQICKEFFDTPMLTSCSHTFCSKCIRTALSTDGCCPACRAQDQASKLRNNWQLQELVSTFLDARPDSLRVARQHQSLLQNGSVRPGKRKRETIVSDRSEQEAGRSTRSKSRRMQASQASQASSISASDAGSDIEYLGDENATQQMLDDGLIECPLGCGQRMKLEQIEPHLDKCEDERKAREAAEARAKARASTNHTKHRERLSELSYAMMKERDLGRKMKDLGIPVWGSKQLMIRRHTAWVNIWNANCDSSRPREQKALLRDLDAWERTQGGNALGHDSGVMKKEFDGNGWMTKNSDEFSKLIQNARRSKDAIAAKLVEAKSSLSQTERPIGGEDERSVSITVPVEDGQPDQSTIVPLRPPGSQEGMLLPNLAEQNTAHHRLPQTSIPSKSIQQPLPSQTDQPPMASTAHCELGLVDGRPPVTTKTPMFATSE